MPVVNKEISWEEHTKSYFLEENTDKSSSKSVEKVIKVYYRFPEDRYHKDTGSSIVLYRHDLSSFHPRINPQLRGKGSKTNKWLDAQNKNKTPYEIPAPYNLKDRVSLCTTIRFTFYEKMKGWFYRYYVPHILAIMIEKDFGYEIVGTRKSSKIFTFDLD